MLVLSLTGRCNFTCRYCYASCHPQETMAFSTAVRAVNLAAQSGEPFMLQFSGGEPFLAFDVMQKIAFYVRQHAIPAVMQVQTNGTLLNPERISFLRQARVGVGVSLDGRPAVNDLLRRLPNGEGTSRHILDGIRQLALHGMDTGLTCVVTAENAAELAGLVEFAYYLGNVRRIGFDLLRGQGRGRDLAYAAAGDVARGMRQVLQKVCQLRQYTGKNMLISQLERVEKLASGQSHGFAHCHAMTGEAGFVDARGGIYACSSLLGDERFRLGDVDAGIDQARHQAITTWIQDRMSFCRDCPDFPLCGGGCFARWYGLEQEGSAYDGECALKRTCIEWYQENKEQE